MSQEFFTEAARGLFEPETRHEPTIIPEDENVLHAYNIFEDNFDRHINASIPVFMETQLQTINVINNNYPKGAAILDIGSSNGTWCKTLSYLNLYHDTTAIDINEQMLAGSNGLAFGNYEQLQQSFAVRCNGVKLYPRVENKFDIIKESMTFQFITGDIHEIDYLLDEVAYTLKDDGIFLTEGKFKNESDDTFDKNEELKKEFKQNHFKAKDIRIKDDNIVTVMNSELVLYNEYMKSLQSKFKHVVLYYRAGNFRGLVCGGNKKTINDFVDATNNGIRRNYFNTKEAIWSKFRSKVNSVTNANMLSTVSRHTRCLEGTIDADNIDVCIDTGGHSYACIMKSGEFKYLIKNQAYINDGFHDRMLQDRLTLPDKSVRKTAFLTCYDIPVLVTKNEIFGFRETSRFKWDDTLALPCSNLIGDKPDILIMTKVDQMNASQG